MSPDSQPILSYYEITANGRVRQTGAAKDCRCEGPEKGYVCKLEISHSWGQYSPFFSVPSEISADIPSGCTLTFAQILSRHGARDPTTSKTKTYSNLVSRIHKTVTHYGPGFESLKDYEYILGADQLTPFGQQELVNSGIKFYNRYRDLASKTTPFIRAAGQDRVVESAQKWTQGYHVQLLKDKTSSDTAFPYPILSIPEEEGVNNTLNHGLCTAFETSTIADPIQAKWLSRFAPPITARLNANLPGANITDKETTYLMDLCAFETVASSRGATISSICDLFSTSEWADYDYFQAVGKWYGYGPGHPLGPTQGVGWVNELISRLTNTPVNDHTTTNTTLDSNTETFPLGRALYADFSHDNDMMGVYGALGLYNGTKDLDPEVRTSAAEAGGFSSAWTVPFAARMYVEKMVCADKTREELVRVLVNDRVVRLKGCGADELGRCRLGDFVESLGFARGGGKWEECHV